MISFLLMKFLTCFRPLSEETVRDLALKSPTKSCALYPIFTGLLKAGIDSLVPLTTCIVNDSLESGTVRDVLKQAIVTPLLKKTKPRLKHAHKLQTCGQSPIHLKNN